MQTIQAAIALPARQCPSSLISFCGATGDFIGNAGLEVGSPGTGRKNYNTLGFFTLNSWQLQNPKLMESLMVF